MDLFHETALPGAAEGEKQRLHFHEFMIRVHKKMHELQCSQEVSVVSTKLGRLVHKREPLPGHPVDLAAQAMAQDCSRLLCLDEMQVTDVADAMILRRSFEVLMRQGVSVVFTANVPPEGLYSDPFLAQSREFFLPFIELLYGACAVQKLGAGGIDYRTAPPPDAAVAAEFADLVKTMPQGGYYDTADAPQALDAAWARATAGHRVQPRDITVEFQRTARIDAAADRHARVAFTTLCQGGAMGWGAADFVALSGAFDTIFVEGVHQFAATQRDEARRFVLLIDALYEQRVQAFFSAACPASRIFHKVAHREECKLEEKLSYMRAVSRLQEMMRVGALAA